MFVDEIEIFAKAGKGGDGVVRWLTERYKPKGGPAGGNGGKGGDVHVVAVRDLSLLSKYTGALVFEAGDGSDGQGRSMHGRDGADFDIKLPIGSVITNTETKKTYELTKEGERILILKGGQGGYGNEHFKSSTNRSPEEHTDGKPGERGTFTVELELVVDVGLVGLPNAGKSTLLNELTNAKSRVGSYPFTTLEPHLGDFYGYVIADIPGLIEGAALGKGLGHKFLRHIKRTKMLLVCVSAEDKGPEETLRVVTRELGEFDSSILSKPSWIVLTKTDVLSQEKLTLVLDSLKGEGREVHPVSILDDDLLKSLSDNLSQALREGEDSATM